MIKLCVTFRNVTLLVIKVVTLELSHISLKGWDVLFEDTPQCSNFKDVT